MNAQTYLSENADYMDETSAAALEHVSDAQWADVMAAHQATVGTDRPGMSSLVTITRETLEDFANSRSRWAEKGKAENHSSFIVYRNCQAVKGQQRVDLTIVNLGEQRLVIKS